jgi:hypothetical protein
MGLLDRLFGSSGNAPARNEPGGADRVASADEQAIERYRYLLKTAPPEAVEQAHAEAFARLTPEQRTEVLRRFSESLPPASSARRAPVTPGDGPAATRAEMRDPGTSSAPWGGVASGWAAASAECSAARSSAAWPDVPRTAIASHFLQGFGGSPLEGLATTNASAGAADPDFSDVESGADSADFDLDGLDAESGFDDLEV